MILHVKEARYLHDYVIWVRFNDGTEGEVDLTGELTGEVFSPLNELAMFKSFCVDPVLETIVWSDGADFAPEFLYEKLRVPYGDQSKANQENRIDMACDPRPEYKGTDKWRIEMMTDG